MALWTWLSQQEITAVEGPNEIFIWQVQIIWELLLTEVQITLGFYQVLDIHATDLLAELWTQNMIGSDAQAQEMRMFGYCQINHGLLLQI